MFRYTECRSPSWVMKPHSSFIRGVPPKPRMSLNCFTKRELRCHFLVLVQFHQKLWMDPRWLNKESWMTVGLMSTPIYLVPFLYGNLFANDVQSSGLWMWVFSHSLNLEHIVNSGGGWNSFRGRAAIFWLVVTSTMRDLRVDDSWTRGFHLVEWWRVPRATLLDEGRKAGA